MIGFLRRPVVHDMTGGHGVPARRTASPHGHAFYIRTAVSVRDIVRLADADWQVEEVHEERAGIYWCRIGRLSARVAA